MPLAAVAIVTFVTCGCSFSYNLGSLIGKDDQAAAPPPPATASENTATNAATAARPTPTEATIRALPTESDLVRARLAVAEAFSRGGATQSTPWENPATGARGTITPINAANASKRGSACRDFLASYVREGNETWLEGQACRSSAGRWRVKRLAPWKRA